MPRLPGRESTRTTYPLDQLLIGYFVPPWDRHVWQQPCVVTGCEHKASDACHERENAGRAVLTTNIERGVGLICPCHVAQLTMA